MLEDVLDWLDLKWGRRVTCKLSWGDLAARQNGISLKRDGWAKDTDESSNVYGQETDILIAGYVGPVIIGTRRHLRPNDYPKDQRLAFRNDGRHLNLEM